MARLRNATLFVLPTALALALAVALVIDRVIDAPTPQTVLVDRVVEVPAPQTVIVDRVVEVAVPETVVVDRLIEIPVPQTVLVERIEVATVMIEEIVERDVEVTVLVDREVQVMVEVPVTVVHTATASPTSAPTVTPTPLPTETPSHTPVATPNPLPTPTAQPTPTPAARPYTAGGEIVVSKREYGHTLNLPEDWVQEGTNHYRGPDANVKVSEPEHLFVPTTLEEYAQSVRDNLDQEWFGPNAESRTTVETFQPITLYGHTFYWMTYRFLGLQGLDQRSVVELIGISDEIPGQRVGLRVRGCCVAESQTVREGELTEIVQSFRLTTNERSDGYYAKFVYLPATTIKSGSLVSDDAIKLAATKFIAMTDESETLTQCLGQEGIEVAIFPNFGQLGWLPEFEYADEGGQPGGEFRFPIAGTPEWDLDPDRESPGNIAVHEFAHAVHHSCMSNPQWNRWLQIYDNVLGTGKITGTYAATNPKEFFAEFSTIYWDTPSPELLGRFGDDDPRQVFPRLFELLDEVYKCCDLAESPTFHDQFRTLNAVVIAAIDSRNPFRLVRTSEGVGGNFNRACRQHLGPGWQLADFKDFLDYHERGGSLRTLVSELKLNYIGDGPSSIDGLPAEFTDGIGYVAVSYLGDTLFGSGRQYFIARHDHNPPPNFLVHDELDNDLMSLGSWLGNNWTAACVNAS